MNPDTSILIVAPHPDDEVLGCGATAKKYADRGARVFLCVVTKAYQPEWSEEFVLGRPTEVASAAAVLGIASVYFLDLPTVRLDTVPQRTLNSAIADIVAQVQPQVLYVPHRGDLNSDHRLVHQAALVAARPSVGQSISRVLAYETLSETEWGVEPFIPTVYEDVQATLSAKIEAMQVYGSEVKEFPHPRSIQAIRALAQKRGSEACLEAAEAFTLVREVR